MIEKKEYLSDFFYIKISIIFSTLYTFLDLLWAIIFFCIYNKIEINTYTFKHYYFILYYLISSFEGLIFYILDSYSSYVLLLLLFKILYFYYYYKNRRKLKCIFAYTFLNS